MRPSSLRVLTKPTLLVALMTLPLALCQPAFAAKPSPEEAKTPPASATRHPSGLISQVLTQGSGTVHPRASDAVLVHYTGWTRDGEQFISSRDRNEGKPITMPLSKVFAGWRLGIQEMVEGETRRLWVPEELGPQRASGGPKSAVFDIELESILSLPHPPAMLTEAPTDATRTPSGAWWKSVRPGEGTEIPGADGRVLLQWTLWDENGGLVNSSQLRGKPTAFMLDRILPAFAEVVQEMTVGEVRNLWIPPSVHGGDWIGAPKKSWLIFHVEVVRILPDSALQIEG